MYFVDVPLSDSDQEMGEAGSDTDDDQGNASGPDDDCSTDANGGPDAWEKGSQCSTVLEDASDREDFDVEYGVPGGSAEEGADQLIPID